MVSNRSHVLEARLRNRTSHSLKLRIPKKSFSHPLKVTAAVSSTASAKQQTKFCVMFLFKTTSEKSRYVEKSHAQRGEKMKRQIHFSIKQKLISIHQTQKLMFYSHLIRHNP